ncbi:substrate-binding domain-containing protein [Streptomyces sp. LN499]|uniref:substrate-binding domain-containing protein n=1 Tax=Streptomyces sp. LN499 TaxID=3112977 RepID=UPI003716C8B3
MEGQRDDESAAAAMRALQERGLRVPEDISVVGYNDDPVAAEVTPRLTTVHIPAEELGRTAVRLALDGPPATGPERHVLGTHIVIRESDQALPRVDVRPCSTAAHRRPTWPGHPHRRKPCACAASRPSPSQHSVCCSPRAPDSSRTPGARPRRAG